MTGQGMLAGPGQVPQRGVLLALDMSKRAIGLAVCDPDRLLVTPLHTIRRRRWQADQDAIIALGRARAAVGIVIGLPLNMDGSHGPAAQSRRDLASLLATAVPDLPVMLQDERLTTQAVADAFAEGRWRRPKAGLPIDHFAAAIILEDAIRVIAEIARNKGRET